MKEGRQGIIKVAIQAIKDLANSSPDATKPAEHLTHDDLRLSLYAELAARRGLMFGPDVILDVEDNFVVFKDGERCFRIEFSIGDENQVQLIGEAEEVQRDTRYVPVGERPVSVQTKDEPVKKTQTEGDTEVDKKIEELAKNLIAHEQTTWSDKDKEILQGMSAEQLERMKSEADARTPVVAASESNPEPVVAVVPASEPVSSNTPSEPVKPVESPSSSPVSQAEQPLTLSTLQEALPGMLDKALDSKLEAFGKTMDERSERKQIATHLMANGWTETELAQLPIESLRKIAQTVIPANYNGLGLPAFVTEEGDDGPPDEPDWS